MHTESIHSALIDSSMAKPDFHPGDIYSRREHIHRRFGGQQQGGISTPKAGPWIFLITGPAGDSYGYIDRFRDDGIFCYTGEGQTGDMKFTGGNRELRDSSLNGKRVFLFEQAGKGSVRFVDEVLCLGHHSEDRADRDGNSRRAIIFELEILGSAGPTANVISADTFDLGHMSLPDLRKLAFAQPQSRTGSARRKCVRMRSMAVREYVLRRAEGKCEGCISPAPFLTRSGRPYLEPHHTTRMADGGPDHPEHVVALCPTCHSRVHHGRDGEQYNAQLIARVRKIETALFC